MNPGFIYIYTGGLDFREFRRLLPARLSPLGVRRQSVCVYRVDHLDGVLCAKIISAVYELASTIPDARVRALRIAGLRSISVDI
jgi:hypothetical protein